MSASTEQPKQQAKSDFLAAEEIKAILGGRERVEQGRILRWVSESLGLIAASGDTARALPHSTISATTAAQDLHERSGTTSPRQKNLRTFVDEKKPKSDVQFATVVAYFYQFEAPESARKEQITADDLREATRIADWDRFKKPSVPLNNAAGLGYLDRAERGAFKLNAVGENLVAMTLPGLGRDSNGPSAPRRKAKKGKSKKQAA